MRYASKMKRCEALHMVVSEVNVKEKGLIEESVLFLRRNYIPSGISGSTSLISLSSDSCQPK
jgi:hypothetical protein